jgi:cytoskeleton protein RodZ
MNQNEDTVTRGPGTLLAAARIRHGLPLAEISARTRIARHLLEALESENWSELPAPVYVRGFIRLYAREVGVDPRVPLGMLDTQAEARVEAEVRAQTEAEAADRQATWDSVRWRAAYSVAIGLIVAVTLAALFSVSPPKIEARSLSPSTAPATEAGPRPQP